MNRADFLRTIGAFSLFPLLGAKSSEQFVLYRCYLRGTQYYTAPKRVYSLRLGQQVTLRREPDNPYDKYAIAVYDRGYKLGFIPRLENKAIARMMDQKVRLEARITRLEPEDSYRPQIGVSVYKQK